MPAGCAGLVEFINMRTLSIVDAHNTTSLLLASSVFRVTASTNSTPVTCRPSLSTRTRETTALLRSVMRPVAWAARKVVAGLEIRESDSPRSGGLRAHNPREMMTRRSPKARSTRSLKTSSAGVIGRGSRKSPSGICGSPSLDPWTP